ncbi:TPA: hypothetical protein ACK3Q6_002777 [Burkholderia cepacia]|uniref:hypothetical protein n=1 Tax=Burkholderia cepacia TaxID=292 RepID=UPI001CF1E6E0|nr:hypothetical protein [Burkholderia cepacia]MCA8361753.1 hypothetical protein [Burkholderia cepacia]
MPSIEKNLQVIVDHPGRTALEVERKAGHIRVKRATQRGKKRGEVIEQIEITPPLAALLDRLEAIRGDKERLYAFTTKFGTHYTRDGFKGLWGKGAERGDRGEGRRASIHVP